MIRMVRRGMMSSSLWCQFGAPNLKVPGLDVGWGLGSSAKNLVFRLL